MKLFLDCEFNGFGGELISLALVDENGQSFYETLACPEPTPWVAEHVMPFLQKEAISITTFQNKLGHFLYRYETLHIIADWPEDLSLFTRALILTPGRCMVTPPLTLELWMDRSQMTVTSSLPHNALADAHALLQSYRSNVDIS